MKCWNSLWGMRWSFLFIFSQSVSLTLYVVLSAYNNPLQNPNNNPLLNPNNNPLLFQLAQGEIAYNNPLSKWRKDKRMLRLHISITNMVNRSGRMVGANATLWLLPPCGHFLVIMQFYQGSGDSTGPSWTTPLDPKMDPARLFLRDPW